MVEKKNEIQGNKVLFKFLNSLNSGTLLYDQNMELLFLNKKMKKFCNQTQVETNRKWMDFTEDCKTNEEKTTNTSIRRKIYKLKNIKCTIPEEKDTSQSQVHCFFNIVI